MNRSWGAEVICLQETKMGVHIQKRDMKRGGVYNRGRAPVGRRERSSSYSGSPSPRKLLRRSRSRSPGRPIKGRSSSNSSRSSSPLLPRKP